MLEKQMKTRIVHKHDIETNWQKATNFVPKQGELIIYDDRYVDAEDVEHIVADAVRFKIGNGADNVNDLAFIDDGFVAKQENTTGLYQAYCNNAHGTAIETLSINHKLSAWSIARRYDNGRLRVATPVEDTDAATKKYVDDAVTGSSIKIVQETGTSTTTVMSQKAVTDALAALREELVAMIESSAQAAAEEIITTGEW